MDAGAWSPCTSPAGYTGLALGPHVFEVRATDPANNVDASPASRSFTVEPEPAPAGRVVVDDVELPPGRARFEAIGRHEVVFQDVAS
jgi:hypothetical protein